MSLPKWMENVDTTVLKQGPLVEALTIAVEALEWVDDYSKGHDEAMKRCREALRRIAEIGNDGPRKSNNLTYEDTV